MATERTHWKSLTNPDYIGAYAFQPNEEKTVTIASVRSEVVMGADGRKEDCTVVHFQGDTKPLILNVTNAKMIQKVLQSPYIEEWVGRSIVLGVETVAAFGERVEAVRVRKKQVTALDCAECGQVIAGQGKFSAQQIASASTKQYGKALCMDCAKEAKAAQQEVHEDDNRKSEEFAQLGGRDKTEATDENE